MAESQQSIPPHSDSSRRTRMLLYSNTEDARRNIMRIPGASSQPTIGGNVYQESPLAGKGQDSGLPLSTADLRNLEEGHGADQHDYRQVDQTFGANRESSQYPQSLRSDPFDLSVSDDDDQQFDYIDQLVAAGRGTEYVDNNNNEYIDNNNNEYYNGGGRFAVLDEGADAEATASQRDRDTTIANIVDAYGYSVVPLTPRGRGHAFAVEQSRAVSPVDYDSDRLSAASFVTNPFEGDSEHLPHVLPARPAGPPILPVPPPSAHLPYYHYRDGTELQTSEQTYGVTGELLQITPAARQIASSSYPWPTGGTDISAAAASYPYFPNREENKENIPPDDSGMAMGAVAGIPAAWSNADLPARTRDSFRDRGLTGQPFIRSSTHYNHQAEEDDAWEDTQASDTHPNLANLAGRPSQDSYADLSDDGTGHRLSLVAPQGQPTLRNVTTFAGSPIVRFGNKAHRVLMSGPHEPAQDMTIKRAKQLLKANMMENKLMGTLADGFGALESQATDREQLRRNEAELENIRKRNPSAVKVAVEQVAQETKKRIPRPYRPPYSPNNSFEKIYQLGLRGEVESVNSGRRGLLDGSQSRYHGELVRSDTMNTFMTIPKVPRGVPPVPGLPAEHWSPLPAQPQIAMTPRGRATATPSTHRTVGPDEYEMEPITRCGTSRAAMTSQTQLLPMTLGVRSPAAFDPGRPLTDAEFMEREPNWTMTSSRRHTRLHVGLPVHANGEEPTLINRDDMQTAALLREQKDISRKYYSATIWCPITAMMFGLGFFDGRAKAKSQGRITKMNKSHKFWALYVATPLGVLTCTIFTVVFVVIYIVTHPSIG
ncbi:hypothetical protein LTR36_004768 [Oleoguttula mirabilis]|uniref:Uncharacterized protein n=1 Tax=Oleoguttula mirabilis TaxID=1507867 RepID=A0AAV9JFI9_9PEZI|nr:hypothetical protein LTR36_004768 [Oleoguttula mirabilis]